MSISFETLTIWSFWETVFNMIEIWLVYKFFIQTLADKKEHTVRPAIGAICLFLYISVLNNLHGIDGKTMTMMSYFGTLSYALAAFKKNFAQKVFVGLLPIVVVICSDFLTFALSILLDVFNPTRAWEPTYERFCMNFIYIGITILFYVVVNQFYQCFQQFLDRSVLFTISFVIVGVLGILTINFLIEIGTELTMLDGNTGWLEIYIIFIGCAFLIIYSSCIFFFKKWNIVQIKNQEMNMQNQYRMLKEEYYGNIQGSLEKLEDFRHDIMKHFQVLSILLVSDQEKAQEYLNNLHSQYSRNLAISNYTNDDVLNAILSNKKSIADKNGIMVRITAEKVGSLPLSSYDICSLFDNLLDNAIEACLKVEEEAERFIDVFIAFFEGQMLITIKNSYRELLQKDQLFMTTKKDKLNHGIGVKIINSIVTNAGGQCIMKHDEKTAIFTVIISIPINDQGE